MRFYHRHDFVIALVKRGANQVIHASINNRKLLARSLFATTNPSGGGLDKTNARNQDTGVADQKTTRLDQDPKSQLAQRWNNRLSVIPDAERRRFATVVGPPLARSEEHT